MTKPPVRTRAEAEAIINARVDEWATIAEKTQCRDLAAIARRQMPSLLNAQVACGEVNLGPLLVRLLGADAVRAALLRDIDVAEFAAESAAGEQP